ncbi:MAG TPA: hypothetical protein VEK57_22090 [Thermoanaerobaculia bacterium]|nr:hypothetical protein [Thermoanaerobaculia bacterium]
MKKKHKRSIEKKETESRLQTLGLVGGTDFDAAMSMRDSFMRHIAALEEEPTETIREQMAARGLEVAGDLWSFIRQLAELGIVIERTDHLDDEALFSFLLGYLDEYVDLPMDPAMTMHIDVLGGCSPEDIELNLRYYADEEEREWWRSDFPKDELPPQHEQPPFDRDRLLPTAEDVRARAMGGRGGKGSCSLSGATGDA